MLNVNCILIKCRKTRQTDQSLAARFTPLPVLSDAHGCDVAIISWPGSLCVTRPLSPRSGPPSEARGGAGLSTQDAPRRPCCQPHVHPPCLLVRLHPAWMPQPVFRLMPPQLLASLMNHGAKPHPSTSLSASKQEKVPNLAKEATFKFLTAGLRLAATPSGGTDPLCEPGGPRPVSPALRPWLP